MPLVGTEQQRLKTEIQLQAERKSIEAEINKLVKERGEAGRKYGQLDAALTAQLQQSYSDIEAHTRKQLGFEQKISDIQTKMRYVSGEKKQRFAALIQGQERRIANEKAHMDMIKIEQTKLLENLDIQTKLKQAEEVRLEKGMAYLGKAGDIFKLQEKHYKGLKGINDVTNKLTQSQLIFKASVYAAAEMMFDMFKKMDDGLAKFRISMGMMRTDMKRLQGDIISVATEFAGVGVDVESAGNAAAALASEFGGTMKISRDLIGTTAIL